MIEKKQISALIPDLLHKNECVIIPGFGGFITNYLSAQIHPVQQKFTPPSSTVAFNANLRTNDGLLATEISRFYHIDYAEALRVVQDYSWWCINELHASRTLEILSVGELRFDDEKNIQFEPDPRANFLNDSFGLTSFVSPAIRRNKQGTHAQHKPVFRDKRERGTWRKVTNVLKWSVMVAPLLMLIFYSVYQTGFINLSTGLSSIGPDIQSSDITKSVNQLIAETEHAFPPAFKSLEENQTVASIPDTTVYRFSNTSVPAAGVDIEAIQEPEGGNVPLAKQPIVNNGKFHIIGGCFAEKEKADAFITTLRQQGYQSELAGTSRKGLVRVSISSFATENEAIAGLSTIKANVSPDAWILEF
jgi:hypothetical protein